ncbi:cytochrome P450 86B1 [Cryptomeria japonica]|uniref:cytochrome P450 86B1 n=1 Tax=Cryptomeria japonica TaxID=3369 RepID=UPI0025AD7958|nr:cytochrome P450 86B1 [Cryptomeria japonica]
MDYYNIALASTMLALISIAKWYSIKSKSSLPLNWPVLGMMPSLLWNISNLYDYTAKVLRENGGTVKFSGPWKTRGLFEVITSSPPNLEHVLKNEFPNFPRGPYFKGVFFDVFGDGLFTADNGLWKRQRKAVAMAMSSSSFRDQTIILLQKLLQEKVIPVLEEAKDKKSFFDLQDIFLRLNFDMICITVLGKDPGCLGSVPLLDVPFAMAFDEAVEACTYRLILPPFFWRCMKFLNVGSEKMLRRAQTVICDFASEMVKCRIEELNSERGIQHGDILSTFIKMEEEEGRAPSEKLLQDLFMSILLAGRDTSALALTWFFWLLSMHPNVEQKIISEITQILKSKHVNNNNNNNSYDKIHMFGLEELRCMNYLQAAISESLRLYPPVPVSYRQAMEDSILPDGTHVKKGSKLLYFIYATNRMENLWGKDALEFKPERWINKEGFCMKEWDYKYPVFNAGPRLCLGRDNAYVSMKFMAANILARYKVKVDPGHIAKPKFGLTLFMKHGLKVSLDSREDIVK